MNVFKIFATMSLVDAISKPLAFIQKSLKSTEGAASGLSARLGRLATGLGQLAAPAAMFLGALGALSGQAMAFESKMADVAKVANFESPAAFRQMSRDLEDLSLRVPMTAAGFADIAAAAASSVEKSRLLEFSEMAAKMGVAFDVAAGEASSAMVAWRNSMGLTLSQTYALADAVNHLSNSIGGVIAADVTEVLNRSGAVGKSLGFTEQQIAALAATGLSAGTSADIVATGLNSLFATLAAGSAMSQEAATAFKTLGFEAQALAQSMQVDAQGTIMEVMEAIANLPKEKQLSIITSAFGQLSLKSVAPMVGNLDNLRQSLALVGEAAQYAGSMQAEYEARSATTENSLQLLKNSFNVLAISLGAQFLPEINMAAQAFARLVQVMIAVVRSPVGSFLLSLTAGIAAALVGVTGLIIAFAALKPVLIMVGAIFSAVLWPILAIAGAVALLALAWKTDFLGMATAVRAFVDRIKLLFQGVLAIFKTLKDGKGELAADLAEKIEAAGLMGLVTTVSRIVYRVLTFFKSIGSSLKATVAPAVSRLEDAFSFLGAAVKELFSPLSRLAGGLAGAVGQSGIGPWKALAQIIGAGLGQALSLLVDILGFVVSALTGLVQIVSAAIGALTGLGASFGDALFEALAFADGLISSVGSLASTISSGVSQAIEAIGNFSLADAGQGLINSLAEGVKAGALNLVSAVTGVLQQVRALLPFSDAQAGPLSNLTASGMAFISTFADGIMARAGALVEAVSGVLSQVRSFLPFSDAQRGPLSNLTASGLAIPGTLAEGVASGAPKLISAADNLFSKVNLAPPYYEMPAPRLGGAEIPAPRLSVQEGGQVENTTRSRWGGAAGQRNITLHIGKIELPSVVDADGFVAGLEAIIRERTEA